MDARELLGRGYPYVLSFQLIFGVLQLLDFFHVRYYPMIQRRPSSRYFELGFSLVVPMVALLILWVAYNFLSGRFSLLFTIAPLFLCLHSVELGVSTTSLFMCFMAVVFLSDRGRFVDTLLWVLSFFFGLGVVHWGVLKPLGVASPLLGYATILYNVHHVLRLSYPVLLLFFLFFWVVKPVISKKFKVPEPVITESKLDRMSWMLLVFSIFLSMYVAVYPYFSTINPNDVDFAVDLPHYEQTVERLDAEGISMIFGSSRMFFHIILALFRLVTGFDTHSSLRFLPMLLNPLFVASSYYIAYEIYRNNRMASWCAFLSSTGVMITSSMFAYFLTNILALSLVLFSLGLLFRALRDNSLSALLGASVLGVLLVFTHPWTMDQFLSGIAVLLGFILFRRESGFKTKGLYLGAYLGVIGLAEVFKILFFGSVGGIAAGATVSRSLLGVDELIRDALYAFPFVLGGTLSNVLLVVLATIGIYILDVKDVPVRYFYFLVLLSSLVYVVTNQTSKLRLVLNIPFGFFAAITLHSLYERKNMFSLAIFSIIYSLFYLLVTVSTLVW